METTETLSEDSDGQMELGTLWQKHEFGFQGHLKDAEASSKKTSSDIQNYYAKRNGKNSL